MRSTKTILPLAPANAARAGAAGNTTDATITLAANRSIQPADIVKQGIPAARRSQPVLPGGPYGATEQDTRRVLKAGETTTARRPERPRPVRSSGPRSSRRRPG